MASGLRLVASWASVAVCGQKFVFGPAIRVGLATVASYVGESL